MTAVCTWFRLGFRGELWDIAPTYVAPVSLADALTHAEAAGCELPTPELVDAIWAAATCRVQPLPRKHDGTAAQMASSTVYADQARLVQSALDSAHLRSGYSLALVAGTHKDVVRVNGKLGLYGWHQLDGRAIQPLNFAHAPAYVDYSQGLRLCRRLGISA